MVFNSFVANNYYVNYKTKFTPNILHNHGPSYEELYKQNGKQESVLT
jgi:hypothetical protein